MPRLGQITLFLSCCNERSARKLGETVNGQKDVYLLLTKPSRKEDLDIGNIAPVYSLRMKTFINFNCMKCSSFFYYCFPPPTPHTLFLLSPLGISIMWILELIYLSLWPLNFSFKLSISFCNILSWLDIPTQERFFVFFSVFIFNF